MSEMRNTDAGTHPWLSLRPFLLGKVPTCLLRATIHSVQKQVIQLFLISISDSSPQAATSCETDPRLEVIITIEGWSASQMFVSTAPSKSPEESGKIGKCKEL